MFFYFVDYHWRKNGWEEKKAENFVLIGVSHNQCEKYIEQTVLHNIHNRRLNRYEMSRMTIVVTSVRHNLKLLRQRIKFGLKQSMINAFREPNVKHQHTHACANISLTRRSERMNLCACVWTNVTIQHAVRERRWKVDDDVAHFSQFCADLLQQPFDIVCTELCGGKRRDSQRVCAPV